MEYEKIMTTKELAEYMKLNEKTILKMAQNKEIPGVKIGSQWRFHLSTIDKYMQREIMSTPRNDLDMIIGTTQHIIPLSRLMDPALMELGLEAGTSGEVLLELAGLAVSNGITDSKKVLFDQLKKREEMLSTAVGGGIAIPHPRNPDSALFKKPNIILGRSKKGIEFSAPDRQKVHLFFMACAPNMVVHLRLIAKISKLLQTDGVITSLTQASNKEEIMQLLLAVERNLLFPAKYFEEIRAYD
ncbi:MAG: PTS sugar transporter subunit IIA [Candidatus Omnitrophota bacterium]